SSARLGRRRRRRPSATAPEDTISTCWPRLASRDASATRAPSQARSGSPVSPSTTRAEPTLLTMRRAAERLVMTSCYRRERAQEKWEPVFRPEPAPTSRPPAPLGGRLVVEVVRARDQAFVHASLLHRLEGRAQQLGDAFAGHARDQERLLARRLLQGLGGGLARVGIERVDLVQGQELGLVLQPLAIGGQLAADGGVGAGD